MHDISYSVVAPMHNEQGNVRPLYEGIKATMDGLGRPYEIIFVNDFSSDRTLLEMKEIQYVDGRFHFVDLAANVGENWALLAGVSKARGEIVITMDGDYQNDPAYIPRLLEELSRGFRVVSGRRKKRTAEFWTRRLPSQIANLMIRIVSGVPVHDCGCGLKVYRREVLEGKFVPKGFMNRFSPVSLGVTGQEFSEVEIIDRPRIAGQSHYGLGRTFVVIRDLCALPYALRGASIWLKRFRLVLALCLSGAFFFAFVGHWLFAGAMLLLTLGCASNVLNLTRFVRAQRQPEFSVKEFR
ncbi:MAG: glycosyltransferase family 2 protein [Candidatus Binatia bacterium]